MMDIFIRLDRKGEWRDTAHRSSVCGLGEEFENLWEDGISCYKIDFDDLSSTVDELRSYWMDVAMLDSPEDYEDFQVTVFRGEKVGNGHDWEDLAICDETLAEFEARPFMEAVIRSFELYDEDELDEDEYSSRLIEALETHVISKIEGVDIK